MKSLRTCGLSPLSRTRGWGAKCAENLAWLAGEARGPLGLSTVLIALLVSCKNADSGVRTEPRFRGAVSSTAMVNSGVCAAQSRSTDDTANALPSRVADYCVNPHADPRRYGVAGALPLRDGCSDLFGERCGEHQSHGLQSIVAQGYLSAHEAGLAVQVHLLQFEEAAGALASFAEVTIGDSEPTRTGLIQFSACDRAAIGAEVAFAVQSRFVVEVRYQDERHIADQVKRDAQRVLPPFVRTLCEKLSSGASKLPPALIGLPEAERVPLGERYVVQDVLGIAGSGPGAIGYYRRGSQRWRVLSIHYDDADAAKDAALTLRKSAGWMPHKQTPYDSFKLTFAVPDTGLSIEWVITQQLNRVWGVGDEVEVLDPSLSDAALAQRRLSYVEKLEQLGKLLHSAR